MGGKTSKSNGHMNGHMNGHSPQETTTMTVHYMMHTVDQLPDGLYISRTKPKTGSITMSKLELLGMMQRKFDIEKEDAMRDNPTTELGDFMRDYFRGNINSITQIDINTNVTDDTYENVADFISEVVDAALKLRREYLSQGYGLISNRVYVTDKIPTMYLNSTQLVFDESPENKKRNIAIKISLWWMVENISLQKHKK